MNQASYPRTCTALIEQTETAQLHGQGVLVLPERDRLDPFRLYSGSSAAGRTNLSFIVAD